MSKGERWEGGSSQSEGIANSATKVTPNRLLSHSHQKYRDSKRGKPARNGFRPTTRFCGVVIINDVFIVREEIIDSPSVETWCSSPWKFDHHDDIQLLLVETISIVSPNKGSGAASLESDDITKQQRQRRGGMNGD
jgi:hypothetical protein